MTKRNRTFVLVMVLLFSALVLSGCGVPQGGQDLTQPLTLSWQGLVDLVAKALILLNDVTFVEAARKLAERVFHEAGRTPEERLILAFRLVLARTPTTGELQGAP